MDDGVTRKPGAGGEATGSDEPSDELLMAAYAKDDARAFEQLFERCAARTHRFFVRYFGSRTLADDLLQATFLKLHAARSSYRAGAPFRPWLYTIAARIRLDELRRRGRAPISATEAELDDAAANADPPSSSSSTSLPTGDDWLEGHERARQVRLALDALPEAQRVVVFLHRFEGMTFEEIAQILSVAPGAVRARAFRAYATLRAALGPLAREGAAK